MSPMYYYSCINLSIYAMHFQRLHKLLTPSIYWGPSLVKHRRLVQHLDNFEIDPYGQERNQDITDDNEVRFHFLSTAANAYRISSSMCIYNYGRTHSLIIISFVE